jgi:hypothetical protein
MSLDEVIAQYQACYECEYFKDCPDAEKKIKDAINRYEPFAMPKPTNPLNPFRPYKSKYFIDRRYDPPKPLHDIWRFFERRKNEQ